MSTHSVNDKADISHGIEKKTPGGISSRNVRTVGGDKSVNNAEKSASNIPKLVERNGEFYSGNAPRNSSIPTPVYRASQSVSGNAPKMRLAPHKKYDVFQNGNTEKKTRVIPRKKAAKLQKAKLKKLKKQQIKFNREQAEIAQFAFGGNPASKKAKPSKLIGGGKKAVNIVKKPVNTLKNQYLSQANKSDDSGIVASGIGLRTGEYGARGLKTAAKVGVKTAKSGAKITKRVYRKIHKPSSAQLRRKLRKQVTRKNIVAQAKYLAKRTAKNAAKTAAKTTGKAAVKAAKAAAKAAMQVAKLAAQAVGKLVSLIAETMPYSLIVIGAVLLIVIMAMVIGGSSGAAGASGKGAGAWTGEDNVTGEEVYETINDFIEEVGDVLKDKALKPLKNTIDSFCDGDTESSRSRRRIIQYQSNTQNVTYFPAKGKNTTIDGYIDDFDLEFYPDYLATLFVLMSRDKLAAENLPETDIADFEFKKSDFEEFINSVNVNVCKYGDTYVVKTTQVIENCECPNANCSRKKIPGCHCASRTDENGKVHYYCGGHSYCPGKHTKLFVRLYTIQKLKKMDLAAIYNFTENEKIRFDGAKAFIEEMVKSYGGDQS